MAEQVTTRSSTPAEVTKLEIYSNEDESKIYNMDLLPCAPLVEELIAYHREGNFDRVMAMMQLMFMIEETYETEYKKEKPKNNAAEFLINQLDKMFIKK